MIPTGRTLELIIGRIVNWDNCEYPQISDWKKCPILISWFILNCYREEPSPKKLDVKKYYNYYPAFVQQDELVILDRSKKKIC